MNKSELNTNETNSLFEDIIPMEFKMYSEYDELVEIELTVEKNR